ncbi:DUF3291 domain-containing protein [Aestuariibaculum suncheonense]|uniref:DUF3291 domain-containing protein n=1 Tax=Aestuariibaculum suncheonense TaxID=1028745 RepID=A0A8J6Q4N9_9FLAO|nr:DUF3291 domain-containing protein [Aestuariibaculum suncheonense]MBD0834998.1 DUF3291 domain-containing protein [Aestuariibaculum suncheonense]
MNSYHLAQVNIAKGLAPLGDLVMQDFINNVDRINAVADNSHGFVWRFKDEDKDEALSIFKEENLLVNISVWENLEALFNYIYNSNHIEVFKRKKEWFNKVQMKHMAFWYVPVGYKPTLEDAKIRLDYLNSHGETPYAFTFKSKFTVIDSINYKTP